MRQYKWKSPQEWFQQLSSESKMEFYTYLVDTGYIDAEKIQEYFESDMEDDGYFYGTPIHPDFPLSPREYNYESAQCVRCTAVFSADECDAIESNSLLDTGTAEDMCSECPEGDCPVRNWCKNGMKIN